MNIEEKIAIMQAFKNGAEIEFKPKTGNIWIGTDNPAWDWFNIEYRVKAEKVLRPYKNAEEFIEASKIHGPYLLYKKINYELPVIIKSDRVDWTKDGDEFSTYEQLKDYFTWADGSFCGIIE